MVGFFHANALWYHERVSKRLIKITRELSKGVDALSFSAPVHAVYNPLEYAWESHKSYLEKYGDGKGRILLLGMNPGPWGMAQTGVPFGEVNAVRDFLGICNPVNKPIQEHPKRPVQGFDCPRSEVSGRRVWEWAKDRFETPEQCFSDIEFSDRLAGAGLFFWQHNIHRFKLFFNLRCPATICHRTCWAWVQNSFNIFTT